MHHMKTVIVIVFVAIVLSLGAAGLYMVRGKEEKKENHMARALSLRIGLSVALFVLLLVMWSLGWIEPTGIIPGQTG